MSCRICGRGNCTESFHSIEEQEEFDKYANMTERELISEVISLSDEVQNLRKIIDIYEKTQCGCCDNVDR